MHSLFFFFLQIPSLRARDWFYNQWLLEVTVGFEIERDHMWACLDMWVGAEVAHDLMVTAARAPPASQVVTFGS